MQRRLLLVLVSIVASACSSEPGDGASSNSDGASGTVSAGGSTSPGSGGTDVEAAGSTAQGGGGGSAGASGGSGRGGSGRGGSAGGGSAGGGSATGGSAVGSGGAGGAAVGGAGGGVAGNGGAGGSVNHTIKDCQVGPIGQWQNITPQGSAYANAFVIDPSNTATVYFTGGSEGNARQKSTDCGNTWFKMNTGRNSDVLKGDGSWTMVIDPVDTQTIWANGNYGAMGIFKTTNGGVDWDKINAPEIAALQYGGFVENIAMDLTDHKHLTVTPHFSCEKPYNPNCMIETTDAGATWKVIEGTPGMGETGGQVMLDATTWLWMSGGVYRTTNAGKSWTKVRGDYFYPYSFYRADNGDYYFGGTGGVAKSTDGAATFQLFANSPHAVGLASDGTNLWVSWQWGPGYQTATTANPTKWSTMPSSSSMSVGGWFMRYDRDHHVLYSANTQAGFWRVTTQ